MSPSPTAPDPADGREELRALTLEVLNHEGSYGLLVGLVMELVGVLERSAGFELEPGTKVVEGGVRIGEGLAISPAQAVLCADEPMRTAVFLRGVHAAISEVLESRDAEQSPVQVLYAGSGPYATLGIPVMTLFPAERVRFTIVDLHPVSIESVQAIVHRLGLEEHVASCVVADACDYSIPEAEVPDVIVSETMDAALSNEPQVAIMRHLAGQAPDARLVPESVQVDAFLLDTSREPERIEPDREDSIPESSPDRIPLGSVFTLDAAAIQSWSAIAGDGLPAGSIEMPEDPDPDYEPYLFTTIVVYGRHVLRTHDCGLTSPRAFPGEGKPVAGARIDFHYRLGASPGLVCSLT